MSDRNLLAPPKIVTVSFDIQAVYNVLDTLESLANHLDYTGTSEWIHRTANNFSPELMRELHIVGAIFVIPAMKLSTLPSVNDFVGFIDDLAKRDPVQMRDTFLEALVNEVFTNTARINKLPVPPKPAQMLEHSELVPRWLELTFRDKCPNYPILPDYYELLSDPPRYQTTVVTFLRRLWYGFLEEDWKRHLAMLQECVRAYQQLNLTGLTALEAIRAVTGRDVSNLNLFDSTPEHITFIPSAHLGPYLSKLGSAPSLRVIFGARLPSGIAGPTALSHSDVLVRLHALADDTRLRILELLAQEGELRAQDIITRLELGQSSVSRHLTQLCATGYITERRRDVNKSYTLNAERLDDTFQALKRLLKR
jgi:DNA-binding transcriptional ArsR family regulator